MMNRVGERIRHLRTEQGITLTELARNVCSVGKMSNVENGKTTLNPEELEKICLKLNIKVSDLYPEEALELNEKIKRDLSYIEDIIFLGYVSEAKKDLHKLKHGIQLVDLEPFILHIMYLEALSEYLLDNLTDAIKLLENIASINGGDSLYEIKSSFLLAKIYFELGQIGNAYKANKTAFYSVGTKQKFATERRKSIFNLVLFNIHLGNLDLAKFYAVELSRYAVDAETLYLIGAISYIEGHYQDTVEKLTKAQELFKQQHHYDMFLQSKIFLYYLSKEYPIDYNFKDLYWMFDPNSDNCANTRSCTKKTLKLFMDYTHLMVEYAIEENDVAEVERHLLDLLKMQQQHPKLDYQYTYYLLARYYRLHKDKNKEVTALQNALKLLNSNAYLEGIILYELKVAKQEPIDELNKKLYDLLISYPSSKSAKYKSLLPGPKF